MARKRTSKPTTYCTGRHVWSAWVAGSKSPLRLIKKCKNCSEVMTLKEFMEYKKEMNLKTIKANTHIDLFWS